MVRWESEKKHHKDTCLYEIELRLQIWLTTPHPLEAERPTVCIQSRNQRTCTSKNRNFEPWEVQFSTPNFCRCYIVDLLMEHKLLRVKSNQHKLEYMKNELKKHPQTLQAQTSDIYILTYLGVPQSDCYPPVSYSFRRSNFCDLCYRKPCFPVTLLISPTTTCIDRRSFQLIPGCAFCGSLIFYALLGL